MEAIPPGSPPWSVQTKRGSRIEDQAYSTCLITPSGVQPIIDHLELHQTLSSKQSPNQLVMYERPKKGTKGEDIHATVQ